MSPSLFQQTPSITAFDSRGLAVRRIEYLRHPDTARATSARITRHRYGASGFLTGSSDPRLHALGHSSLECVTDLAGKPLRTRSADAGTEVRLHDGARREAFAVSRIRGDGQAPDDLDEALTRTWQYEDTNLPGRPLALTEQVAGEARRISERFVWGGASAREQDFNLAGQCVSHYGTEGLASIDSVSLRGVVLQETRRLLAQADLAQTMADWQGTGPDDWNAGLAEERWGTCTEVDACAAVLSITDAQGHRRRFVHDVAGLPKASWVSVADSPEQIVVKACTYSANGHKLQEEHGNHVVTRYGYEARSERLIRIRTERPPGHPAGAMLLQDLHYQYDPCGNVLRVTDEAQAIRFWRNQRVAPETSLDYDSLYQLIGAKGREMAALSASVDDVTYTRYQRSYRYDMAGNLLKIHHATPATAHAVNLALVVSERSNRALADSLVGAPAEVEALFTAGGQQKVLAPGQTLAWTPRGHLASVTSATGDLDERYRYDSRGQRVLKTGARGNGSAERCHYLPHLELRTSHNGARATGQLHVLLCGQVRLLHWVSGKPDGVANDQLRFSYVDRLGSGLLELDQHGQVLSREEYYPYGGTAVWAASSQVEGDGKTLRYSGKERDATGLYYYGQRYYQSWLGRWLSADPAGTVDGLNLFRAMGNNPVTFKDADGRVPTLPEQKAKPGDDRLSGTSTMSTAIEPALPDGQREAIYSLPFSTAPLDPRFSYGYAFISVELSKEYLIHMDTRSQGRNLLITAHGVHLPFDKSFSIPEGVDLSYYNPHGSFLIDPGIASVFSDANKVFVTLGGDSAMPFKEKAADLLQRGDMKGLSGSRKVHHSANYRLFNYSGDDQQKLVLALLDSRLRNPQEKFDILSVRGLNSFARLFKWASLKGALNTLEKRGIKYHNVHALFCRVTVGGGLRRFDPLKARDV